MVPVTSVHSTRERVFSVVAGQIVNKKGALSYLQVKCFSIVICTFGAILEHLKKTSPNHIINFALKREYGSLHIPLKALRYRTFSLDLWNLVTLYLGKFLVESTAK